MFGDRNPMQQAGFLAGGHGLDRSLFEFAAENRLKFFSYQRITSYLDRPSQSLFLPGAMQSKQSRRAPATQ